ncbi:MAG: DEAD/DEAH box helicase [bacterium]
MTPTEQPQNTDSPSPNASSPSSPDGDSSGKPRRRRRRGKSGSGQGGEKSAPTAAAQNGNPSGEARAEGRRGEKSGGAGGRGRNRRRRGKAEESFGRAAARKGPAFDPEGVYEGHSFVEESGDDLGLGDFDPASAPEAFRALGLAPELLRAIVGLGFTEPTPIQVSAIPVVFEGKDLIGCAQTGTGKTAAFALPTLQRLKGRTGTRVLVLVPTRELAVQVADHFRFLGKHLPLQTAVIYGGVDYEPQLRALRANVDVIVATPGRLLDHMGRGTARLDGLEVLILDEADRILDMGFADEINKILKQIPKKRQTMLFSATIPPTIESLARRALTDPVNISIATPSTPAEGILHGVYPIGGSNKSRAALAIIEHEDATSVLIFSRTKAGADHLCDVLEARGVSVARIHSDRSQRQRENALNGFREGRHRVLVATDIASRGIDVTGISHVINYDVPEYPEDYVHRAGRTARAGMIGYALTLMSPGELMLVKNIERFIGKALPRVGIAALSDDVHQRSVGGEPLPLKDQPEVARYNRFRRAPPRRTGLSLR